MTRPKIRIVGTLRRSEENGFQFSIFTPSGQTLWLEALPDAMEWPGLGMQAPEMPPHASIKERAEWNRAHDEYYLALHADPTYRQAAAKFLELQGREPQRLWDTVSWAYRNKVFRVDSNEPTSVRDEKREALLIKHYVLRTERHYERVRREVEALENIEKLEGISREPIPDAVRLYVWQRDKGQCVKCGSRERLEFDHIIPIVAGGSSTERNIQLLCELCNRSKGADI